MRFTRGELLKLAPVVAAVIFVLQITAQELVYAFTVGNVDNRLLVTVSDSLGNRFVPQFVTLTEPLGRQHTGWANESGEFIFEELFPGKYRLQVLADTDSFWSATTIYEEEVEIGTGYFRAALRIPQVVSNTELVRRQHFYYVDASGNSFEIPQRYSK